MSLSVSSPSAPDAGPRGGSAASRSDQTLARSVRRHALGWLVAANAVGVWLAACLLWPALGDLIPPLTYGRWMPLHLDWQLYGWCALPLAGALLRHYFPAGADPRPARMALAAWSAALVLGGLDWLAGDASGKLFLDWRGPARDFFILSLALLWVVLAWQLAAGRSGWSRAGRAGRLALLLALAAVPPVLWWSAGREVYPAVNPHSGGATGTSLLESTLGLIAIFGLLPLLLGVARRPDAPPTARLFWTAFTLTVVFSLLIDHGDASHHAASQILGLVLLLAWVPLLWLHLRGFAWSPAMRPWLLAAGAWWLLLVAQGLVIFLPGFSERLKFTNGLVSHAHLAMAGLLTSVNLVILHQLSPSAPFPHRRRAFWSWQGGCLVQVAALQAFGWIEGGDSSAAFLGGPAVQTAYGLRLFAGLLMFAASIVWLRTAWRTHSPA